MVWDHGLWPRQDREAMKERVESTGGRWRLLYFPVEREELLRRLAERNSRGDANALLGRGDRGAGLVLRRRRAPGGGDHGRFGGPAIGEPVEGNVAEGEAGAGDVDAAGVPVGVLQQAGRFSADGRRVLGPGAGGKLFDPPAQIVPGARAPLEGAQASVSGSGRWPGALWLPEATVTEEWARRILRGSPWRSRW